MFFDIPKDVKYVYNIGLDDHAALATRNDRRIYLTSLIRTAWDDDDFSDISICTKIVDDIMDYNRYDEEHQIPVDERTPIRLYINCPGGDQSEGFSAISAIKLSKTPVYTINIGRWCSMGFLIGIAGRKRFSLPYMTFLMHDGFNSGFDSGSKLQDKVEFDKRFENEGVKTHVLNHSKMSSEEYDALVRVEYYMLPEDALRQGFIDEIVTDITSTL